MLSFLFVTNLHEFRKMKILLGLKNVQMAKNTKDDDKHSRTLKIETNVG